MYKGRNHSGRLVKNISFDPVAVIRPFTRPLAENSMEIMLTMTTVERK